MISGKSITFPKSATVVSTKKKHITKISQKATELTSTPCKSAFEKVRKKHEALSRPENLKNKQQKRPKGPSTVSEETPFCEMCEEISEENTTRPCLVRNGLMNILPG
jgi:hypothetical protein